MAKPRTPIPASTAAAVLFAADRTCCVCRKVGEPIQLHHVDEDPTNHDPDNLAVLCLGCHDETQVKGGFSRRLDRDQIHLYRDSWNQAIAAGRSTTVEGEGSGPGANAMDAELATSLVEINRKAGSWINLAYLYDAIGNDDLRDNAVETAIDGGVSDEVLVMLRRLQGRLAEVPSQVIEAEFTRLTGGNSYRIAAVMHEDLADYRQAAESYLGGLCGGFKEYEDFTLAFYLKELAETNIVSGLFVNALQQAADEDDLWWQVRALEELGWTTELHALVLENRERIEVDKALGNDQRCRLRIIAAEATDDVRLLRKARMDLECIEASVDWSDF